MTIAPKAFRIGSRGVLGLTANNAKQPLLCGFKSQIHLPELIGYPTLALEGLLDTHLLKLFAGRRQAHRASPVWLQLVEVKVLTAGHLPVRCASPAPLRGPDVQPVGRPKANAQVTLAIYEGRHPPGLKPIALGKIVAHSIQTQAQHPDEGAEIEIR